MAMDLGELFVKLSIKDEGLEKGLSGAQKAATSAGQSMSTLDSAIEKANTGLAKAKTTLDAYKGNLEASQMQLDNLSRALEQQRADLVALDEAASASAIKAQELAAEHERLVATMGETSKAAQAVAKELAATEKENTQLNAKYERTEAAIKRNEVAFKKAENAVKKYQNQIRLAEDTVGKFTNTVETLNGDGFADTGAKIDGAADSLGKFDDILDGGLSKAISNSSRQLGTLSAKMLGINTASATGIVATKGLTVAIKALAETAAPVLGVAAAIAAIGYGAYKLYDVASGAKATRDAIEGMNGVLEDWNENLTTSIETAKGLETFGIDASKIDVNLPKIENAENWVEELVAVWTDGEKESDEIVKAWTDSFTKDSDEIRNGLQELKDSAGGATWLEPYVNSLDGDMQKLDEMDKYIEELLKKRQNGYLTDDEIQQLQMYQDMKQEIEVKYNLVPDEGGISNEMDQMQTRIESMLRRGEDSSTVFEEGYRAATDALTAYATELENTYDEQYQLIMQSDEIVDKSEALSQLDSWYSDEAKKNTLEYADALKELSAATGVFENGGEYQKSMEQILRITDELRKGSDASAETISNIFSRMDEDSFVSMMAVLDSMRVSAEEMGEDLPEDIQKVIDALDLLRNGDSEVYEGVDKKLAQTVQSMFGDISAEENELLVNINADYLTGAIQAAINGEEYEIIATPKLDPKVDPVEIPYTFVYSNSNAPLDEFDEASKKVFSDMVIPDQALKIAEYKLKELEDIAEKGKSLTIGDWLGMLGTNFAIDLDNASHGGADFEDFAQYFANGMQLMKEGQLSPADTEKLRQLIEVYRDLISVEAEVNENSLGLTGTPVADALAKGIEEYGWEMTGDTIESELESALEQIDMSSSGAGLADETASGFTNQASANNSKFYAAGESNARAYLDGFNTTAEIASPSRVMMRNAGFMVKGFTDEIYASERLIKRAGEHMANAFTVSAEVANPGAGVQKSMYAGIADAMRGSNVIDYDRLAEAVAVHPTNMYINGRQLASTQADNNALASSARNRAISIGYGR